MHPQLEIPYLDPVARSLIRRHQRQIMDRDPEILTMSHLAARAFLPWDRSPTFRSPIQPVGNVILVVLSYHAITCRSGKQRERLYLRGFRAGIDPLTARTTWEAGGSSFAYDLGRRIVPRGHGPTLSAENTVLIHTGLDLDRAIQKQQKQDFPIVGWPILPPTLLGFPKGTKFQPEFTSTVRAKATNEKIHWVEAWHRLHDSWRIPNSQNKTGHELIDTRLCTRIRSGPGWCGSLAEYHDLRELLDRSFYNPIRYAPIPAGLSNQRVVEQMRRRLSLELASACSDQDLLIAVRNPQAPLIVHGLSRVQVWRPPQEGRYPESFQFIKDGHAADLWHVNPRWMGFLKSRSQPQVVSPT